MNLPKTIIALAVALGLAACQSPYLPLKSIATAAGGTPSGGSSGGGSGGGGGGGGSTWNYTVTFDSQGSHLWGFYQAVASTVPATTLASPTTKTVVSPATKTGSIPGIDPTKTNWDYLNWQTSAISMTAFGGNTTVTGNTTVYARWYRAWTGGLATSSDGTYVLAGRGDPWYPNDLYLSSDHGATFANMTNINTGGSVGGYWTGTYIDQVNPTMMAAVSNLSPAHVYYSNDTGATWNRVGNLSIDWVSTIAGAKAQASRPGTIYYAYTNNSTGRFDTYKLIGRNTSTGFSTSGENRMTASAIALNDPGFGINTVTCSDDGITQVAMEGDVFGTATSHGAIWLSTNATTVGGTTYTIISGAAGQPGNAADIRSALVTPDGLKVLAAEDGKVWVYDLATTTWTSSTTGLPAERGAVVAADSTGALQLYVSANHGLYLSTNSGASLASVSGTTSGAASNNGWAGSPILGVAMSTAGNPYQVHLVYAENNLFRFTVTGGVPGALTGSTTWPETTP